MAKLYYRNSRARRPKKRRPWTRGTTYKVLFWSMIIGHIVYWAYNHPEQIMAAKDWLVAHGKQIYGKYQEWKHLLR